MLSVRPWVIITTRKRSLGQGNMFISVVSSILFTGGVWPRGRGVPGPGGCLVWGVPAPGGWCLVEDPPPTATAADDTHPTGMHSCCKTVVGQVVGDVILFDTIPVFFSLHTRYRMDHGPVCVSVSNLVKKLQIRILNKTVDSYIMVHHPMRTELASVSHPSLKGHLHFRASSRERSLSVSTFTSWPSIANRPNWLGIRCGHKWQDFAKYTDLNLEFIVLPDKLDTCPIRSDNETTYRWISIYLFLRNTATFFCSQWNSCTTTDRNAEVLRQLRLVSAHSCLSGVLLTDISCWYCCCCCSGIHLEFTPHIQISPQPNHRNKKTKGSHISFLQMGI